MFGVRSHLTSTAIGVCVGATCGALLGWSGASALAPTSEGPGYGGNAAALEIVVVGESVRVSGSGFLASSDVVVAAGALTTTVVADEFGDIETTLSVGAVAADGGDPITASGTSPIGSPTTSTLQIDSGSPGTSAAVIGAGIGAVPALLRTRRSRSH